MAQGSKTERLAVVGDEWSTRDDVMRVINDFILVRVIAVTLVLCFLTCTFPTGLLRSKKKNLTTVLHRVCYGYGTSGP